MSSEFRVQSSELNPKLEIRNPKPETGLKKATKEFEAFFLSYMLKTMRESVPKDGLLSGGKGEEIYTSMLDEALSKQMSERGGIGIGELMLKQMGKDHNAPAFGTPSLVKEGAGGS